MKKNKIKLVLFILIFINLSLFSQTDSISKEEKKIKTNNQYSLTLNFEQDFLLEYLGLSHLNSDRNYTQGLGINFYTKPNTKLEHKIFKNKIGDNTLSFPSEFFFQFGAFTPDDLRDSMPIIGDRPYSTIFLLGHSISLMNTIEHTVTSISFSIGALGIDGPAKNIQTYIHSKMNDNNTKDPYNPMGWHNQISNGGEPTILISMNKSRLITKNPINNEIDYFKKNNSKDISKRLNVILSYNWGWNFGYITDINAGITLKAGRIDLSNWSQDLFNNLKSVSHAHNVKNEIGNYFDLNNRICEFYLFASFHPSFQIYNGSLHGGLRKSEYRLCYKETNFFNAQARFGLAKSNKCSAFSVFWAFKSPEMCNSFSRIHSWGGFNKTIYF